MARRPSRRARSRAECAAVEEGEGGGIDDEIRDNARLSVSHTLSPLNRCGLGAKGTTNSFVGGGNSDSHDKAYVYSKKR